MQNTIYALWLDDAYEQVVGYFASHDIVFTTTRLCVASAQLQHLWQFDTLYRSIEIVTLESDGTHAALAEPIKLSRDI